MENINFNYILNQLNYEEKNVLRVLEKIIYKINKCANSVDFLIEGQQTTQKRKRKTNLQVRTNT